MFEVVTAYVAATPTILSSEDVTNSRISVAGVYLFPNEIVGVGVSGEKTRF